jgi:hypothetical protein
MSEISILAQTTAEQEPRFLRRQFTGTATRPQIIFDLIVGVIVPILCLVFDPIVFRSGFGSRDGILKDWQLFAYIVIGLEVATLALWLALPSRAGAWLSAIGGILLAGAIFSFAIALVILPISLLGLVFYFIGVLGFTPFLTGFIYLRNGRRALGAAGASGLTGPLLLGIVFVLGVPAVAQWRVSRMVTESVQELIGGDAHQQAAATSRLKYLSWIVSRELDDLVWAYTSATDQARKERLARAYREITGEDIEGRLYILND